jgi:hypothetical protein
VWGLLIGSAVLHSPKSTGLFLPFLSDDRRCTHGRGLSSAFQYLAVCADGPVARHPKDPLVGSSVGGYRELR